jgi:catechol 2,3-dioxygenase-like lactoylglutathione lyase family enzyme
VSAAAAPQIRRIVRFGLTSHDAGRLSRFYQDALGCRQLSSTRVAGARFETLMHVRGGARCVTLALGGQTIEILEFDEPGRAYPGDSSPADVMFQHFAVVVGSMNSACRRLAQTGAWTAISTQGPQTLPPRSGGVTAFKFRDPDGHPLEFIEFPTGRIPERWRGAAAGSLFLGVDHSAISVGESRRSTDFYRSLGLTVTSQTLNHGVEQQRLDGVAHARVEVISLAPNTPAPHLELLCYENRPPRRVEWQANDVPATRTLVETARGLDGSDDVNRPDGEDCARLVLDPDGHRLQLLSSAPEA